MVQLGQGIGFTNQLSYDVVPASNTVRFLIFSAVIMPVAIAGDHRHRGTAPWTARSAAPAPLVQYAISEPSRDTTLVDRDHLGVFGSDRSLMHAHTCFRVRPESQHHAPMQDLAWDPWTWEVFCGQFTGGTTIRHARPPC